MMDFETEILDTLKSRTNVSAIIHGAEILRGYGEGEQFVVVDFASAPPLDLSAAIVESGMTLSALASTPLLERRGLIEAKFHPVPIFDMQIEGMLERKGGRIRNTYGLVDITEGVKIGGSDAIAFDLISLQPPRGRRT